MFNARLNALIAMADAVTDANSRNDVSTAQAEQTRLAATQRRFTAALERHLRAHPPAGRRRAPRSEAQTAEFALVQSTRIADALEGILDVLRYQVSSLPVPSVSAC